MIEYLRTTTDDVQKADVVKRLGELAERFAPDTQWFIDTMNQANAPSLHHGIHGHLLQYLLRLYPDIGSIAVYMLHDWTFDTRIRPKKYNGCRQQMRK